PSRSSAPTSASSRSSCVHAETGRARAADLSVRRSCASLHRALKRLPWGLRLIWLFLRPFPEPCYSPGQTERGGCSPREDDMAPTGRAAEAAPCGGRSRGGPGRLVGLVMLAGALVATRAPPLRVAISPHRAPATEDSVDHLSDAHREPLAAM